jgi:oxygen-independent coproporphyrinogen-3 oxidase
LQLGLYVHVPFCASTCDFCAFYQEKPQRGAIERYLEGAAQELAYYRQTYGPLPASTVFWGGGTPGLLPPKDLEQLGQAVLGALAGPPTEWTVEMAPSTVKPDKLAVLKDLGVNRLSMGVQSFQPRLLEALGRQHSLEQIMRAYEHLQNSGIGNINLDLMFALPGQTEAQAQADIDQAASLGPQHLSLYCLTFEEDTALYLRLAQGKVRRDKEREASLYLRAWERLGQHGYTHYEVANFARPGYACQHNLATWHMQDWIGIGPSAASQYAGKRYSHAPSLETWLGHIRARPVQYLQHSDLPHLTVATDCLVFGLRLNAGVDLAALKARFGASVAWQALEPLWQSLVANELATWKGPQTLALTQTGLLVADAIALQVMQVLE